MPRYQRQSCSQRYTIDCFLSKKPNGIVIAAAIVAVRSREDFPSGRIVPWSHVSTLFGAPS